MATISITRKIIFTEEDVKIIKDSTPTELYLNAIKDLVEKNENLESTKESRFDAYHR